MDLLFFLVISLTLLLFSITKGYFIAYPLLLSLAIFIVVLFLRGFPLKTLIALALAGSQKTFSILSILLLIGAVTAVWMAAGTVPALVYYGIKLLNPQYFIFSTFILTSFISTLLGTSFGTVSTIGVALMVMARGSGVSPNLIAGAIIAGAYFGDRCSPMSSSANLIVSLTQTRIHTNILNMVRTTKIPFILSCLFYFILSIFNPVEINNKSLFIEITRVFHINLFVLLPALTILVLSVFRVEVNLSLLLSVIVSIAIAMIVQGYSLLEVLRFALLGFNLESGTNLKSIIGGGGVVSMVKVSVVVVVSTALAGLLAGTKVLGAMVLLGFW